MAKTSAYDVLESITEEMDIVHRVTEYPWRLRICTATYQLLKEFDATGRPAWKRELFYQQNGHEYIRAVHNENIPFILDYRIVLDESLNVATNYGTVVELDDEIEPAVRVRMNRNWDEASSNRHSKRITKS